MLLVYSALAAAASAIGFSDASGVEIQVPSHRRPLFDGKVYGRALALDATGHFRPALELYLQAQGQEPENARRATFHAKLNDDILKFETAGRSLTPNDELSLAINYANKFSALKRETGRRNRRLFERAEHYLRRSMIAMPTEVNPVVCLAGLYAENDDPNRARRTFAMLSGRVIPPLDRYNVACYYYSLGEIDRALATLRTFFGDLVPKLRSFYQAWILGSDDFFSLHDDPRLLSIFVNPSGPSRIFRRRP